MEPLEDKLKRALEPMDAPDGFAARVMARVAREERRVGTPRSGFFAVVYGWLERAAGGMQRIPRPAWSTAVAGGLVCLVLVVTVGGRVIWEHRTYVGQQEILGEQARAQLMLALKITGNRLSQVHELVSDGRLGRVAE